MPVLEARIETERPSRYLVQFCKHAAAMGGPGGHSPRMHLHGTMARHPAQIHSEWSDTHGTVTITPWGRCTVAADDEASALTLHIDATDEEGLHQIQSIVARNFGRFSHRDPLHLAWYQPETPDPAPRQNDGEAPHPSRRGGHMGWIPAKRRTIVLVVAAVLFIALHLGLGGAVVTYSDWTGPVGIAVLAALALKVTLIALARRGIHRRKAAGGPDET